MLELLGLFGIILLGIFTIISSAWLQGYLNSMEEPVPPIIQILAIIGLAAIFFVIWIGFAAIFYVFFRSVV